MRPATNSMTSKQKLAMKTIAAAKATSRFTRQEYNDNPSNNSGGLTRETTPHLCARTVSRAAPGRGTGQRSAHAVDDEGQGGDIQDRTGSRRANSAQHPEKSQRGARRTVRRICETSHSRRSAHRCIRSDDRADGRGEPPAHAQRKTPRQHGRDPGGYL